MLQHVTSMNVHRVYIETDLTAMEFMFRTENCICESNAEWRCTKYDTDYAMNFLVANEKKFPGHKMTCLFFTKRNSVKWLQDTCEKLFDTRPKLEHIARISWVEKFYTPFDDIMLEDLYDEMDAMEWGDSRPSMSMNLQKFCALHIRPFHPSTNLTISTFANGNLNVTGITSPELFDMLLVFITTKLYPLMQKHQI